MAVRRTLLLVGGAGRMGRRLGGFFRRRGFRVLVLDPKGPPPGFAAGRLDDAASADVVVVAAALPRVGEALDEVLSRKPRGLVFDVASVKAPVEKALRKAAREGTAVASVHPMFGPSVSSFRGRDLIVCDAGDAGAARRARRLFEGAGLKIRTMPIEDHDPWVARTMGLAHFVALASGSTLARSGVAASGLDGLASTSFRRLLGLVAPILEQPSDLTLPIQTANPTTKEILDLFAEEVDAWRRAVAAADPAAFESKRRATRRSLLS